MSDSKVSQELLHVIRGPSTAFICGQLARDAEDSEPSAFQGFDEVCRLLPVHHSRLLKLGSEVNHMKDGDLLIVDLDPHDVSLYHLVELCGSWHS